jgi:SWI/SNF-related matrix-associated actin-dependent regulator of chromatin subfamily A-like protein 1
VIKLNDLKSRSAISILEKYEGRNPYIRKMQKEYLKNKKVKLTETQTRYIVDFHDKEPQLINRVVGISSFLGEELKKQHDLSFTPERILIEFMLAETDKTFHVYGKLKKNQEKSKMYWLPKTQVVDDPYFENIDIDVDFEKYTQLDKQKRIPFEHQKEGIKFLLSRNGCILADDMGLGKTYQAIVAALESGAQRILIVCPSAVKINWEREINDFDPNTSIISGRNWDRKKFTIINYDILKNFHTLGDGKKGKDGVVVEFNRELVNSKFDLCIIDEAHYLKNNDSIRGEIMVDLCVKHNIPKVWLLTGTPIANRPMDFYNLLKLIKAPIVDNWKFYVQRYCEGRRFFKTLKNGRRKQIWLTNGASNLEELSVRTRNLILRRKKEDVLDMPEKTVSPIYQELSKKAWNQYETLWDEYLKKRQAERKKGTPDKDLVELILLRRFIALEAIPYTIEEAENAIEQGQKVIIFTSFTDELNELAEHFGSRCVTHNGPMSEAAKQYSVDEFQNNPDVKVFIGNIRSAGVGITLTAANYVIFNSYDWVPGNNEQAEDRAYRIGQKNNVTVKYQLFLDTVSMKMWWTLKKKKNIINTIMNEKNISIDDIETEIMDEFILKDYEK